MSLERLHVLEPRDGSNELESTVPTDMTVSSYSDDDRSRRKKDTQSYSKERRQFIHEIQLLKIELSQKNSIIKSLQSDLTSKSEVFDERMKDAIHQKQMLQARVQAQLRISEEDSKRQLGMLKKEMMMFEEKEKRFQALEDSVKSLKLALENFNFSQAQFTRLKVRPKNGLTLSDFVTLKIYEYMENYKKENDDLQQKLNAAESQLKSLQKQICTFRESLENERAQHGELKESHRKLLVSYKQMQSSVEHRNYATENFDRVKSERDRLEREILDAKDQILELKSGHVQAVQEKDDMKDECAQLKRTQALLQQQCEHLENEVGNLTQRWGEARDKCIQLEMQLDHSKSSREELFNRFIHSKEKMLQDCERNFKEEKEKISSSLKVFYEKEIRSLKEEKSTLLRQKEMAETLATEMKSKYDQLCADLHLKENTELYHVKNLQVELESRRSENQNLSLSLNELKRALQEKHIEKDKLLTKVELLEKEIDSLKAAYNEKLHHLEKELGDKRARLEMFEKLEHEFDDVVRLAAEAEDKKSEMMLESFGDQFGMAKSSRVTVARCVDLSRKVLHLEKTVRSLQKELQDEKGINSQIREKLFKANALLENVDQPYSYLISTVKSKEDHIQNLNFRISDLLKRLDYDKSEIAAVVQENDELKADLEKLLKHKEELAKMKEVLESLKQQQIQSILPEASGDGVHKSGETSAPDWYKKLRKQQ